MIDLKQTQGTYTSCSRCMVLDKTGRSLCMIWTEKWFRSTTPYDVGTKSALVRFWRMTLILLAVSGDCCAAERQVSLPTSHRVAVIERRIDVFEGLSGDILHVLERQQQQIQNLKRELDYFKTDNRNKPTAEYVAGLNARLLRFERSQPTKDLITQLEQRIATLERSSKPDLRFRPLSVAPMAGIAVRTESPVAGAATLTGRWQLNGDWFDLIQGSTALYLRHHTGSIMVWLHPAPDGSYSGTIRTPFAQNSIRSLSDNTLTVHPRLPNELSVKTHAARWSGREAVRSPASAY